MNDNTPKYDVRAVERRYGDELGGTEYRCLDCSELFWSPYASSAIEHCPRCGQSDIEETGLALIGELQPSAGYKSWRRVQIAIERATRGENR